VKDANMVDDSQIVVARAEERRARRVLEEGCAADLASIDRLIARPLAIARHELLECLTGTGTVGDLSVRQALVYRSAEEIVARCVESVCDNANVRFRARFRMYAEAVCESESRLIATPRRIALPWLDLGDIPTPTPPVGCSAEPIDEWISELVVHLRGALQREVEAALRKVVRRIVASVARSRARRALRRLRTPVRRRTR
jgi:hypothetical protein